MKHLKKFENSEYDHISEDIAEIKSILIDLKDNYADITGEIYPYESTDKKIKGLTLIINTQHTLPKSDIFSIEYLKLKLELIKSILEVLERIETSLNKKCRVINIWESGYTESISANGGKVQINII
jgi:hypothetical protein